MLLYSLPDHERVAVRPLVQLDRRRGIRLETLVHIIPCFILFLVSLLSLSFFNCA